MESEFPSQITINGKVVRIVMNDSGLTGLLMPLQALFRAAEKFGTNQKFP